MKKLVFLTALLAAILGKPALADVRVGVGTDAWAVSGYAVDAYNRVYWSNWDFLVNANVTFDAKINRHIAMGARLGFLFDITAGVPGLMTDFEFRFIPARELYIEALAGPWLIVLDEPIRLHAAFGIGYRGENVHVGLEASYLSPAPMIGVRLAFPL